MLKQENLRNKVQTCVFMVCAFGLFLSIFFNRAQMTSGVSNTAKTTTATQSAASAIKNSPEVSGGKNMSAPASTAVPSADYNLSNAEAAHISVDAGLNPSDSSRSAMNVSDLADQNKNITTAVAPGVGSESSAASSIPAYQPAAGIVSYPSFGSVPAYRSSSSSVVSSSQSSVSASTVQAPGSDTTSPASENISSDQSSDNTASAPSSSSDSEPVASAASGAQLSRSINSAQILATPGQTNLDVTDFGGVPDVQQFYVSTVSNSPVVSVTGTNVFSSSDIGKLIEVFRAGPWITYSNWGPVVTQQDIICLIANVSNGTNLTLTIPCGWTMNAYCIVGTNNASAFQAAINEASNLVQTAGYTNVTINIPTGTYLMVSTNVLDTNSWISGLFTTHNALTISSGGITLMGDPDGGTVLMGCGAGMEHIVYPDTPLTVISSGYAPYLPMRDTLIWCAGPVQNNGLPLVFQNLTFDGGVQQGAQDYNYWTLIQGNGEGWDTSHHAIADWDGYDSFQMNMLKVFTNCVFQHWRGEMLIGWTGNMPGAKIDIADCTFYDGNATADNMYYGQHIHGCTFNQIEKVTEYYQYNGDSPTIFEDNIITNIAGNGLVINGATTHVIPPYYTIRNNTFYGTLNVADILFTPACNVVITNNQFYQPAIGISFTGLGLQPSDGTAAVMSNIVIVANDFHDTSLPIWSDGYPVEDVTVANNLSANLGQFAFAVGGWKTNWVFSNNTSSGYMDSSAVQAGSYFIDGTSDNMGWFGYNDYIGQTNWISYGNGSKHMITQATPNSVLAFGSDSNLLPPGAVIKVYNMTSLTVPLYISPGNQPNNNNNPPPNDNQSNNNNNGQTVTPQELGQMYKSNVSAATFFGALLSMWFPELSNIGVTPANVNIPAASSPADNASGAIALAPNQTLTFVWNNGTWTQQAPE